MNRVMLAIFEVDVLLLRGTLALRVFCEEWFSWSCRGMERGLIVLYVLPSVAEGLRIRHHGHSVLDTAMASIVFLCVVVVGRMMWWQQKEPDSMRARRLFLTVMALVRVSLALLAVFSLAIGLLPPRHWYDLVLASPMTFYAVFEVSISLPVGGDRRGRRRKLAAAKLKELFGSWLPVPEGTPA